MKSLNDALQSILSEPTPDNLVALQGAILVSGWQGDDVDRSLELVGRFHAYLCELESKISAKDFSELASRLDIGAVGAVALENVIGGGSENFWQRFLIGGLAEVLMVAASRQYVKAWEVETGLVHNCAAWYLTGALWRTSTVMQPELPAEQRWNAIQSLLAPAHGPDLSGPEKALLLGRVFQVLLLAHLSRLLSVSEAG